jgi:hypothetical protein
VHAQGAQPLERQCRQHEHPNAHQQRKVARIDDNIDLQSRARRSTNAAQ